MSYDHETVLDMWAAGKTAPQIKAALEMRAPEAVRTIINRARNRGDLRASRRRHAGEREAFTQATPGMKLPHSLARHLEPEAVRRKMTPAALAEAVLRNVISDNLFRAVLDR